MNEHTAIVNEAQQRLAELRNVARALWPDRDDPQVLSELNSVITRLRAAERVIKEAQR